VSDEQSGDAETTGGSEADEAVFEAPAVLRMLWADPEHMPEHLALWSLKRFGPRASSAVEKLRSSYPDTDQEELERVVIEHQTRLSMTEGAFVGGPFVLFIPVAFCAALLAQAQMALELATVAGHNPSDQMRAADLLVLQGAYASTAEASAALAKVVRDPKHREGKRLPRGSRMSMIKRMAYMLGVVGSSGEKRSRLRTLLDIALVGVVVLVGLVLPLIWVPFMGLAFRRSGLQMGERATIFYAQGEAREAGVTVRKAQTARIGMSAGLVRMAILILVPILAGVIALLTGADLGGSRWLTVVIGLVAVSALATLVWLAYRWWRRRRRFRHRLAATPSAV
jgi:hypothetical protein